METTVTLLIPHRRVAGYLGEILTELKRELVTAKAVAKRTVLQGLAGTGILEAKCKQGIEICNILTW